MKLLYLDESHDEKYYCLAGLVVDDTKYRIFEELIESTLAKEGIDVSIEIHVKEMWGGKRAPEPWKGMGQDRVAQVVRSLFQAIAGYAGPKFIVAATAVTKKNDHEKYFWLLEEVFPRALKEVEKAGSSNKQLLIVFDQRDDIGGSIYQHISELKRIIGAGKKKVAIVDYGYEGDSRYSRMLQITDLVAFFYRRYKRMQIDPTLFGKETDEREVKLLKEIFEEILPKRKIIQVQV